MRVNPLFAVIFLMVTSLFTPGSANASEIGGGSTGGGPGIFCPASVTGQPSIQTLDLYEGRINDNLQIPESSKPYIQQLNEALKKLDFEFSLEIDLKRALSLVMTQSSFLPAGVSLQVPPDLGRDDAVPLPTGCALGAIGYYQSDDVLKISSDAFNALSETQKTAFWLHEAYYWLVRDKDSEYRGSSQPVRSFVAHLLAQDQSEQKLMSVSRLGSWLSDLPGANKPTWDAPPGARSWFPRDLYEDGVFTQISPILLPSSELQVELTVRDSDYPEKVDPSYLDLSNQLNRGINCSYAADSSTALMPGYSALHRKGQATFTAMIPANCENLVVRAPQLTAKVQTRGTYDLIISHQLIVSGEFAITPDELLFMPVYYQQDLDSDLKLPSSLMH